MVFLHLTCGWLGGLQHCECSAGVEAARRLFLVPYDEMGAPADCSCHTVITGVVSATIACCPLRGALAALTEHVLAGGLCCSQF